MRLERLGTLALVGLGALLFACERAAVPTGGLLTLDDAGSLGSSPSTALVSLGASADVTPPSAPSNLVWSSTGMTVTMGWGASTDDVGVDRYDFYYGSYFIGSTQETMATLIGFKVGTPYVFTVKARDAAGNTSAASNQITVLLNAGDDTTPPSAPTNLASTSVSGTQVSLRWTASIDDVGVVMYQVLQGGALVANTFGTTSATVSGLTPGTTYTFAVRAADAAGNVSLASTALSVKTATQSYTLTVGVSGSGATSPAAGTYSYASGASVTVTAVAGAGTTFAGWNGAVSGTTNPVTIIMDGDKTLTASFSHNSAGGIRYVGRVITTDPSAVKLGWQGAGLVATVHGSTIAVKLETESDSVYYQPVIDGTPGDRILGSAGAEQTVTLASGLSDADHVVELYRESEGWAVCTFLGFTSGTVVGAPASSGRLIELVGDSITAGYGNLGVEYHPNWTADPACHYSIDTSSWYATYGAIAGRALGAEVSTVAHSGWGLYWDRGGSLSGAMPTVYENATSAGDWLGKWDFQAQPQVVVVNLGTNDTAASGGFPSSNYTAAGIAFAKTIRSHYPNAWIVFTNGPLLNQAQLDAVNAAHVAIVQARKAAGDTRVASFDLGIQNLGSNGEIASGCDWHPSAAEHERMAGVLVAKIQELLGW